MGAPPQKAVASRPRKVGPYRVLRKLGAGGMAVVYQGIHETLQRQVAIKELTAGPKDLEAVSRFRREALALAGFRHQNIVTLYDLVEKNGAPYMVMELVDGPTLAELLRAGPLPAPVAAVIAAQLASALEHAHLARIVHRDIKPSNVMLSRDGEVKLMDFGIAKDDDLTALTQEGLAVGTPLYMSPEQVSGTPIDHRTDLYSLGVMLYECLSGKKPFAGGTAGEIFARVRAGKVIPLRKVAPQVPRALERVVRRAMRVDPAQRYFDAAALHRDLELYLSRALRISHSALLIACLHQRQHLTRTEALAKVTERDLRVLDAIEASPARWRRLKWASIALLTGGAAAAVTAKGPAVAQALRALLP